MSRIMSIGPVLAIAIGVLTCPVGARASEAPPGGVWRIVAAGELKGKGFHPLERAEAPLLGQAVSFRENSVIGPAPLGCASASYSYESVPALGFFQAYAGNEEEARRIAASTELPDPANSLTVSCDAGTFDFHMSDTKRMVIMIDLVIYTLTKD